MDTTVRNVLPKDLEQIVRLGEEFGLLSQKIHGFKVNRDRIEEFSSMIITNPKCIGLVLEDKGSITGILAALLTKSFFSDDLIAQEMVWYVKENSKGGIFLMLELEKQAKLKGATKIAMGYKPDYLDMKSIYERRGFKLLELQYMKDL